ncbi:IS66 family transposase zinc-finger binding domain-containing protein, partial [Limosilactobacillus reuteri]
MDCLHCPHCHQLMKKVGQHVYSREARLKPAELYCVNLIQETYK